MLEPEVTAFLERHHGDERSGIPEPLKSIALAADGRIERLTVPSSTGCPTRYVIKRLQPLDGWIARATRDDRMREHQLAASAIPSAFPAGIGHAILHSALLESGGVAIIMRDVSSSLASSGDGILTAEQATRLLESLARLHSTFYGFPARLLSSIGLCPLGAWLTLFRPSKSLREPSAPTGSVPAMLIPGWQSFARLAPGAWSIIEPLLENPQPLVSALRDCPDTLLHGDVEARHVAFDEDRIILLDWSLCTRAPAALDLAWFLANSATALQLQIDDAIEIYRAERARLRRLPATGEQWERELALALLAGTMRIGWALALGTESDDDTVRARSLSSLGWWATAAIDGLRWL